MTSTGEEYPMYSTGEVYPMYSTGEGGIPTMGRRVYPTMGRRVYHCYSLLFTVIPGLTWF